MYSKRRQPRKQKKSRSGLRKTQRGGIFGKGRESLISKLDGARDAFRNTTDALSGAVSSTRADLETHQELPSRVDGLQATVAELQKRLDAIEPMLNNLNADFKMLLDVFTTNFNAIAPPPNYDAFKLNMSKRMRDIVAAIYQREQSVTGESS